MTAARFKALLLLSEFYCWSMRSARVFLFICLFVVCRLCVMLWGWGCWELQRRADCFSFSHFFCLIIIFLMKDFLVFCEKLHIFVSSSSASSFRSNTAWGVGGASLCVSGVNDQLQSCYFPVHEGLLLWRDEGIRLVMCAWVCRCVRTNRLKCFMLKSKDPTGVIPKVGSVRLILGVVCTSC